MNWGEDVLGIDLMGCGTWIGEDDSRITEFEKQDKQNDDNHIFQDRDKAKEKALGEKVIKALEFEV